MLLLNTNIKDIDNMLKNVKVSLYIYIFISSELTSILSF
jgi:hypothetical protein